MGKIKEIVMFICGLAGTMARKWACLKKLDLISAAVFGGKGFRRDFKRDKEEWFDQSVKRDWNKPKTRGVWN